MIIKNRYTGDVIFDGEKSELYGEKLRGADLTGADLTEADLTGANLTGVNLTGANLREADLTGEKLRGADLFNCIGNGIESEYNELLDNAGCVIEAIVDALQDTIDIQNSMTLAVYIQNYIKAAPESYVKHVIERDMVEFLVKIVTDSMLETAKNLHEMGPY